jgi:hypothetical protein
MSERFRVRLSWTCLTAGMRFMIQSPSPDWITKSSSQCPLSLCGEPDFKYFSVLDGQSAVPVNPVFFTRGSQGLDIFPLCPARDDTA